MGTRDSCGDVRTSSCFPAACLVGLALASLGTGWAAAADPTGVEFFEQKIRPVLVEHCYKCHSAQAKAPKGGLLLDSREGLLKGGDSGPAVVPGKPDAGLLMKAVRYTDEALRMPPKSKLPDAIVADLAKWIAQGAPDPRTSSTSFKIVAAPPAARSHWAFQPIQAPLIPGVRDTAWPRTLVDHFVLARLEERGLSPSPPADKRTLIRRATVDLTGLPPAPAEIDAFLADDSPDAFARVVDRLLASPVYGERWGRHWLDVARYADTKDGVLLYGDDRVRPYAYTYRDYVIRAFNEDLPFDRFVHEQLAADRIEPKVEPWRLAALGFLTLGRQFDNNIHDILDDQIDTVSRGLLGLTVACARCHDHKYDPIPQADYYALYGVFASSEAPLELPLLEPLGGNPAFAEFEKQDAPKRQEVRKVLDDQYTLLLETARQRVGDYLVHAATTKPDPLETAIFFLSLQPSDLRPQIVARWRRFLEQNARPDDPVFGPWHDLMQLPEADFAEHAREVRDRWRERPAGVDRGQLNPLVRTALEKASLTSRAEVARVYGDLLRGVYEKSKGTPPAVAGVSAGATAESVQDAEARQQLLALVTSPDSPAYFPKSRTRDFMSRGEKDAFGGKLQALDRMAVKAANAPPRAMVLQDAEQPCEPRIFVRGNPSQPGERVPRQFLAIATAGPRQPFTHGSGRLDLARAITAPDNPLTSRVIVNRVWMHHFGEPLVENPGDFGTRTGAPANPQLLDFLAARLQRDGWSLKKLHRLLMLSSVYQQESFDRPECRRFDPDNRLLWRMNRQRLDLEAMRDSLLAVSGRLERKLGGRPVDVVNDAQNRRRTVYGLVDRQGLPGLFRAFDFANPDQSAERRPQTTVPQQALFGMNAPFVLEQARALAARSEVAGAANPPQRVAALYRLVLGRKPNADELRLALDFVDAAERARQEPQKSQLDPWQEYAQVLLLTNEMMFVD
jgi:Protein of unknown function (DUF1553)/Protein of unknown function (DUF1549)/Planctomycete cytochrome C